ncbi:hypothetical protein LCGC14_2364030 [marine sediment metagenome]|uniref:Recombination endonuclease VII n=1 Tax=marine sediment metagenome TaxID=412755 RepID=A0A0F9F0H6_9ZZZZ
MTTKKKEYNRQWNLKNKEKCAKAQKIYRAKNKKKCTESQRNTDLKRHYGITAKKYDCLYDLQNGRCLICDEKKKVLCVDHNHVTKKIRGLLCLRCNLGLGFIEKSLEFFSKAQRYLKDRMG